MSEAPCSEVWVTALGVRVQILAEPSVANALRAAWSSCMTTGQEAAQLVVDAADVQTHTGAATTDELLQRITEVVTAGVVSARAGELLMLHACAVADPRSGGAVVLVGPSGMGKTTLAATLARRWGYVTDETVGVGPAGVVVAYPKPLSIVCRAQGHKQQVSPVQLGLLPVDAEMHVNRVVLLDRRASPCGVDVSPIPTIPAIALLAEHTSYLSALDQPLTRLAHLLHHSGGLLRVGYTEARQLVPFVDRWLVGDS